MYGLDYGHAEGVAIFGEDPRKYSLTVNEFRGEQGKVTSVVTSEAKVNGSTIEKIPGSEKIWPSDLVILSMGFISPEATIATKLGLELDQRNNIHAEYGYFRTNIDGVFAAGDCRRGQSLVVWAINEGRGVAKSCHEFLQHRAQNSQEYYQDEF